MQSLKKRVATLLKNQKPGLVGSIYLPTHPQSSSENISADKTRFKNAVQYIRHHKDYDESVLGKSLKKLDDLYEDTDFWKYQEQGLAILFDAESLEIFKLPFEVTEAQYLTNHFVISPLLIMAQIDTTFYVLDVNFTKPRLFRGTRGQLIEVNAENMPDSHDDEVGTDEYKKELQHRSSGVGAYHGHTENDTVDDEARRYLKIVADTVDDFLGNKHAPLLLAGTENRTDAIRKELDYKFVMNENHAGSVEHKNSTELYESISELVLAHLQEDRRVAIAKLEEAAPKFVAIGSDEIIEITKAERGGRIETLYLPIYRLTKDSIQAGDNTAFIIELPEDIASLETLVAAVVNQGGEILPIEIDAHKILDQPKALCRY